MDTKIKEIEGKLTISLYLPVLLVKEIDKERGQISRNEFIKSLIAKQMQVQA